MRARAFPIRSCLRPAARVRWFALLPALWLACGSESGAGTSKDGGSSGSGSSMGGAGGNSTGSGGAQSGRGGSTGSGGAVGSGGGGGSSSGGGTGAGGSTGIGGSAGMGAGGTAGSGGASGAGGGGRDAAVGAGGSGGGMDAVDAARDGAPPLDGRVGNFSFFVTSLPAMRELSGSMNGFGGNLGGLTGADSICQRIAAKVGYGQKTWRAFLSATKGPDGMPVHAIDRVGNGPWYDRNGRLVAMNKAGLLMERPAGDPQTISDLPNELGQPQKQFGDNHDTMTGTNRMGRLNSTDPLATCMDWTSVAPAGTEGKVMSGHSWPRTPTSARNWMSEHTLRGCAAGVNLMNNGAGSGNCVGCSGGYGGIYCFALEP